MSEQFQNPIDWYRHNFNRQDKVFLYNLRHTGVQEDITIQENRLKMKKKGGCKCLT